MAERVSGKTVDDVERPRELEDENENTKSKKMHANLTFEHSALALLPARESAS
jgi:hypothetical protein